MCVFWGLWLLTVFFVDSLVMADHRGLSQETPRRSSSSSGDKKRQKREDDVPRGEVKKKKEDSASTPQPCDVDAPPPAVAGPSGYSVNKADTGENFDRLSGLLSSLIEKLDYKADSTTPRSSVRGDHDFSSSGGEDGELSECLPDPLDDLDALCSSQHSGEDLENEVFIQALEDFSGIFHGEEKKGKPLSDRLASILNVSLRRRPTTEGVKTACSKINIPSNVPNMTVPATNSAITKAMSVGGKLLDTRICHTNGVLVKALVPIAQCVSDIGEKTEKPVASYLSDLNNSLRLLTSAVNYLNQLRKEVARIHVNDSALAELCKWECEVGREDLFPFDVVKKCDEIHKTRKLGRPSFRPYKYSRSRRQAPHRQDSRKFTYPQTRQRSFQRPFLGHKAPQGRGTLNYRTPQ